MSLHEENRELNELLKSVSSAARAVAPNKPRHASYIDEEDDDSPAGAAAGFSQWTSTDGTKYFPAGDTFSILKPGLWEPKYCGNRGYYFEKLECKTDGLLEFPETNSKRVVAEIQNFWSKEQLFEDYSLAYKRGIILWGPPGSGKSCTIKLVLKDVVQRGGVAVKFNIPQIFIENIRIFRKVQKTTPLVVLLEDIDSIISEFGETDVLNILDGVENINKVVYLATTNYPEQLGERIINRPSRFDRRFKMPHPGKSSRRLYLEHLLKPETVKELKINLNTWVRDTNGMSIAHLKELCTSVCLLGDPYKEVIKILRSMVEDKVSSMDDKTEDFGFAKFSGVEED